MSSYLHGKRWLKDVAVSGAQYSLGLMYAQGVFVEQDYIEAAKWYQKASENGHGGAAHNLGMMYFKGEGVPRNDKMAEMHWNRAMTLKNSYAAEALMNYYIMHLEPEKAKTMFHTGKRLGSNELNEVSEEQFNKMIESAFNRLMQRFGKDLKQLEAVVIAFERKHKLDTKGMTYFERLQRQIIGNDPLKEKILNYVEQIGGTDKWGGMLRFEGIDMESLERLAKKGSITAQNVMKAIYTGSELFAFLKENECESDAEKRHVLELLYKCCTGEFHMQSMWLHGTIKNKLKTIIGQFILNGCGGKGEDDMKIRFCYACFNSLSAEKTENTLWIEILKQGIKMYPDNVYYYDCLSNIYGMNGDPKSGLEWCEKGLEKHPTHVELLYSKAAHLRHLSQFHTSNADSTSSKVFLCKTVAAYNEYLTQAPADHRKRPSAFYALADIMLMEEDFCGRYSSNVLEKVELYFNKGQEAECKMLPCYLPYGETDIKRSVEMVLLMAKTKKSLSHDQLISKPLSQPAPKPILERKQYLMSPVREQLVLNHRQHQQRLVDMAKKLKNSAFIAENSTFAPKLIQTPPTKMSKLKPITLSGMNPTCDSIFEDRIIDFTIIEEPVFGYSSIHLIAEDGNGDVARLYIYNVEQNKEAAMNLAYGSTIAIMNPYLRIGKLDGRTSIRNDEPICILFLGKVENMCRFCGEENAQRKCSKCKKVYCSKECQELDWNLLKHRLICSSQ